MTKLVGLSNWYAANLRSDVKGQGHWE